MRQSMSRISGPSMVNRRGFDRFGSSAANGTAVKILGEQKELIRFLWLHLCQKNDATDVEEIFVGLYRERFLDMWHYVMSD